MKNKVFAQFLDSNDKLAKYRDKFFYPMIILTKVAILFAENSLGLQPKKLKNFLIENYLSGLEEVF